MPKDPRSCNKGFYRELETAWWHSVTTTRVGQMKQWGFGESAPLQVQLIWWTCSNCIVSLDFSQYVFILIIYNRHVLESKGQHCCQQLLHQLVVRCDALPFKSPNTSPKPAQNSRDPPPILHCFVCVTEGSKRKARGREEITTAFLVNSKQSDGGFKP